MALTAIPVGFVAGLFGIGGGLITVPFLYYIFGQLGVDQKYIMHLAVGTSFAIIIPTSMVSVLTHHKFNAVDFKREVLDTDIGGLYRHIGMYAYRRETLFHFSNLPITRSEELTNLEQMRAINNGILIKTILTNSLQLSVDTKEDLKKIKEIMRSNSELYN